MKSTLVRISAIAGLLMGIQTVLLSQTSKGNLLVSGVIVPSYQLTITVDGKSYVAQGTTQIAVSATAGSARVRVEKANSRSETFRLEVDGKRIGSGVYGQETDITIPGNAGEPVRLLLNTE